MSLYQINNFDVQINFDKIKRYLLQLSPQKRQEVLNSFTNNNVMPSEFGINESNQEIIFAKPLFKIAIKQTLESLPIIATLAKYWPNIHSYYLQKSQSEQENIINETRNGHYGPDYWKLLNINDVNPLLLSADHYTMVKDYLYYVFSTLKTNNINTTKDFISNFPLQKVIIDDSRLQDILTNLSTFDEKKLRSILVDLYNLNRNGFISIGLTDVETTSLIVDLKNIKTLMKLRKIVEEEYAKHLIYNESPKLKKYFMAMSKDQQKQFLMNVDNEDEWDKINMGSISYNFKSYPYLKKMFVDEVQKLYGENIVSTDNYKSNHKNADVELYDDNNADFVFNEIDMSSSEQNLNEQKPKPKSLYGMIKSTKKIFKNPFKKTGGKRRTKKSRKYKKHKTNKRKRRC